MPAPSTSDTILKWLAGLMLTIIVTGGGLYGKWINDSIHDNQKSTNHIIELEAKRGENLDILNAKLDLVLQYEGIKYNGPKYQSLRDQGPKQ